MTTFYVTTGVSLSEHSRCWDFRHGETGLKPAQLDAARRARSFHDIVHSNHGWTYLKDMTRKRACILDGFPDTDKPSLEDYNTVLADFDKACWSHDYRHLLPAELATLHNLAANNGIAAKDVFYFVGSLSNRKETLICGELARRCLSRLTVDVRPTILTNDWDPTSQAEFCAAMKELNENIGVDKYCAYILTGGYKAVLMSLVKHLMLKGAEESKIHYLNERGDEVVSIDVGTLKPPHVPMPT